MSDKNFKVKSGLNIPIASANILTTDSSGNVSSSATLAISSGGTGQTSAANAINALLPVQNGSIVNYAIQSDGTNVSWAKVYNQLIKNSGTSVNPRRNINFVGASFADDSNSDTTTITLVDGNLTGPITSIGAATSIASQTGTGTKFVVDTSPTIVTPTLSGATVAGTINGTTIPSTKTLVVTTDTLAVHAATTSAQLAGVISDETGSGALVFGTGPALTLPVINNYKTGYTTTATAAGTTTLTSASNKIQLFTGVTTQTVVLPVTSTLATGMQYEIHNNSTGTVTVRSSGLYTVVAITAGLSYLITCIGTALTTAADWDADFMGATFITGTGSVVLATSPTLVTPALGTPSAVVLTSGTGLPLTTGVTGTLPVANGGTGITSLGTGVATFLATPSSANLAAAVTGETGTGALVFADTPTLVTPNIGAATGTSLTLSGDLTVNGTTTNINSTNLVVEDKNIVLGDTATPSDATADGGGITLKGTTDHTFNWVDATDAWTSSEHMDLVTGKDYKINNVAIKDVAETLTNKTLTSPTLTTPALGTPASGTMTNVTGLPVSTGISGLGTGVATFLATPSSANLAAAITDETGSGALVFGTSPSISNLTITGTLTAGGGVGTNGQVLTSTGTGVQYTTISAGGSPATPTTLGTVHAETSTTLTDPVSLGFNALLANTTGTNNTAVGAGALDANTTSSDNTAVGKDALGANTGGINTAVGSQALFTNTTGASNTAVGYQALRLNNSGGQNTAIGDRALAANVSSYNSAVGYLALNVNTSGTNNVAVGALSLDTNTTGGNNTAVGYEALGANTTGTNNTAVGQTALLFANSGVANTAVGANALLVTQNGYNTGIGVNTGLINTSGTNNTFIGYNADGLTASTSNNITLGNASVVRFRIPGIDLDLNKNIEIMNIMGAY